jgi:hypothetical protein
MHNFTSPIDQILMFTVHVIFHLLLIRTPLLAEWNFFFVDLYIVAVRVKTFHFEMQLIIGYLQHDDPSDVPRGRSYTLYVAFIPGVGMVAQ